MLTCEKSTPQRFQCILLMHGRYVTHILKMCMKKFNAENNYVWTNLQGFDLHIAGGYTESLACSQFLVFTSVKNCCKLHGRVYVMREPIASYPI